MPGDGVPGDGGAGTPGGRVREPAPAVAGWGAVLLGAAVVVAVVTRGIGPDGVAADLAQTLARAAADLLAVVAAGAALAVLLAPGRTPGADRVLTAAAPLWSAVLVAETFVRGALVSGRRLTEVRGPDVLEFLTGPRAGTGQLVAVAAALALAGVAGSRPARPGTGPGPAALALVLVVVAAAAPVATGHTAASTVAWFAVPAVVVHVAAALLWLGGLGAVLVTARDTDVLAVALPRFSRLALGAVVALGVSGALAATARLSAPVELVTTAYGAVVATKVVLLAVAAALGGITRSRLRAGRLPVLVWAAVEVLVLAGATGVAATLTHTA
ncbi:Copper resistance protein CopD [Pseudonocardia sp. Ae406_Ps2]|nr:Copper resistance protein CopD [Pseudonocardia sp. Ae331_Ps2]OLM02967.1 Copper resistance protein CopD [Pseudonocardia sp. Ae406_Ps2]OLM24545.1 Copper resistance protein CopD [Pseudonocardia sp. Ae706_Ps2]